MANRISNGMKLTSQSWRALMDNKHLLVFPLISLGVGILVTIVVGIILLISGVLTALTSSAPEAELSGGQGIFGFIVLLVGGFISTFMVMFSNAALIGSAMRLAKGKEATVQDGIDIAMKHISTLAVFSVISVVVGTIANAARNAGRDSNNVVGAIAGAIVGGLIQGSWNVAVFFAVPVIVAENAGPMDALRGSWELFKQTWGEGFTGSTTIGGIGCIVSFAVLILGGVFIFIAVSAGSAVLTIFAIVITVAGLMLVGLMQGAINGIFRASLYEYAKTGDAGRFIDNELAREAFAH